MSTLLGMKGVDEVWDVLDRVGLVTRKDNPFLVGAMEWLQRTGRLKTLLPGVLVASGAEASFETRVAAVAAWDPDAVVSGLAAARLGYWPEAPVDEVVVITRRRLRPRKGYRFIRARVDPEHVVQTPAGIRHTSPTWTALWLADSDNGAATDEALRTGGSSTQQLAEGLQQMRGRRGTRMRRFVVRNSRENPWSVAERRMHRMFFDAGITDWHGNFRIPLSDGVVTVDVCFPRIRLVLEFDGFETHSRREVFHADREKGLRLMAEGWLVVRFSMRQLEDPEAFLDWVHAAMAMAARLTA